MTRLLPIEQARAIVVAGTPGDVAERLMPYTDLGVNLFLVQDRVPFDDETLRLFAEQVAPRVHERVSIVGGQQA